MSRTNYGWSGIGALAHRYTHTVLAPLPKYRGGCHVNGGVDGVHCHESNAYQ